MTPPGEVRRLWRIVRTDLPTRDDFVSCAVQGQPPPTDSDRARLWDGLSRFATEPQARRAARRYPSLGTYLAAVDVPDDEGGRVERTLSTSVYYMVWGNVDVLLASP